MSRPQDITQLHSFLGTVTYYPNMWPRCSLILAPLTQLTGKSTFEWMNQYEIVFQQMKSIISTDVLLAYPDHTLSFHIYTDASNYQLDAVIIQNGRPMTY